MRFLYNISIIVGSICTVYLASLIIKHIKNKIKCRQYTKQPKEHELHTKVTSKSNKVDFTSWALLIASFALIAINLTCGPVTRHIFDIHNLETESEGVYCYYVTISNNGNEYTLPAQISIIHNSADDPDGHPYYWTEYHIEKVYFSNGGYLTFEDFNEVEINEPTYLTDTSERDWKCTLLNEHAYSPRVEETNNLSALTIIEFIVGLIGNLFLFVFFVIGIFG